MPILHLFILAITQAATEFLPISSSGHLLALSETTDIDSTLAIDVILHMGTLLALVIYYRKKLAEIIKNLYSGGDSRLLRNMVISSVPAVIAGLAFEDAIEGDVRSISVVITMLLLVGLIMVFESVLLPKKTTTTMGKLSGWRALGVGLAQSVALIPGTSRSGSSIIGGRLAGLSNKEAADYAFLIGIPVIFGAGMKTLLEDGARDLIVNNTGDMIFGLLVAAITGWLAIDILLKVLKKVGLKWFGVYRVALALLLLIVVS